jgi:hypothetical protein
MQQVTTATQSGTGLSTVREFFNPLLSHEGLSYYLEDINPLWSLVDLRARVVAVINETHDTKTFVFLYPGFSRISQRVRRKQYGKLGASTVS